MFWRHTRVYPNLTQGEAVVTLAAAASLGSREFPAAWLLESQQACPARTASPRGEERQQSSTLCSQRSFQTPSLSIHCRTVSRRDGRHAARPISRRPALNRCSHGNSENRHRKI